MSNLSEFAGTKKLNNLKPFLAGPLIFPIIY